MYIHTYTYVVIFTHIMHVIPISAELLSSEVRERLSIISGMPAELTGIRQKWIGLVEAPGAAGSAPRLYGAPHNAPCVLSVEPHASALDFISDSRNHNKDNEK